LNENNQHATSVEAWMQMAAKGLTSPQLLDLFENVLDTLWERALRTLGDVTLVAIVDRVLHGTALRSPLLGALKVDASGFHCDELRKRADTPAELAQAMRLFIVEFLTVIGSLTAEILSPALHAELEGTTRAPASVLSNEGKPR
jgi:hypothetical protein